MVQRTEQSFAHYQNITHQDTQANTNTLGDRSLNHLRKM